MWLCWTDPVGLYTRLSHNQSNLDVPFYYRIYCITPSTAWMCNHDCSALEHLFATTDQGRPQQANSRLVQVSALFHIASTNTPPPFPDNITDTCRDFLTLCLQRYTALCLVGCVVHSIARVAFLLSE